jgi:hypothetical protein
MSLAYRGQQSPVSGAEVEEPLDPRGERCQQHRLGDGPIRHLAR